MLNKESPLTPIFAALADPTRRAIVEQLSGGPASVSKIAAPLPMSLPAVMLHLKALEASGLIHSRKQGRVRTCSLDTAPLSQAELWITQRRKFLDAQLDRLEAFLAEDLNETGRTET